MTNRLRFELGGDDCVLQIRQFKHGVAVYGRVLVDYFDSLTKLVEVMDSSCTHMLLLSGLEDPDFGSPVLVFGSPENRRAWVAEILWRSEGRYGKGTVHAWWYGPNRGASSGYLVSTWANQTGKPFPTSAEYALPHDSSDWQRCVDAMEYLGFKLSDVTFPDGNLWRKIQEREAELMSGDPDEILTQIVKLAPPDVDHEFQIEHDGSVKRVTHEP